MPVFMCRWPDGDISFAAASSRLRAAEMLDELGAVKLEELRAVREFMVHLRLTDVGALELSSIAGLTSAISPGFGCACSEQIDAQYPEIAAVLEFFEERENLSEQGDDATLGAAMREAVAKERERLVWQKDRHLRRHGRVR
jgi:hypothetical protein